MSEEGYLQTKLKEQSEEIIELKKRIKELEIEFTWARKGFSEAKEFMFKAGDINNFKKSLINQLEDEIKIIRKDFDARIKFIQLNNQKFIDHSLAEVAKILDDKCKANIQTFIAALSKILTEKNILTMNDLEILLDKHVEDFLSWQKKERAKYDR